MKQIFYSSVLISLVLAFASPMLALADDGTSTPNEITTQQETASFDDSSHLLEAETNSPTTKNGDTNDNTGSMEFTNECELKANAIAPAGDSEEMKTDSSDDDSATLADVSDAEADTKTEISKASPTEDNSVESTPSNQTIEDNVYIIETSVSDLQVLDVQSASSDSGANVQTYTCNGTDAQRWNITFDTKTSSYIVVNVSSGKSLDLSAGTPCDGANIQQYESNGTAAQRWLFIKNTDGTYTIVSALDDHYALDVSAARNEDGTNIQLWTRNGSIAQNFWLLGGNPTLPTVPAEIEEGCYNVVSVLDGNAALDIAGASNADEANVQVYSSNSTGAQKFYFACQDDGAYSIYNIASGKVLDVSYGSLISSANVWQYAYNGTDAQKWIPVYNQALGAYAFVSKLSGMYLDISGASAVDGANVQVFRGNGTAAQFFKLNSTTFLKDGIYAISTAEDEYLTMDVVSGGTTTGSPLQAYTSNGTLAQRFELVATGFNTYTMRSACSGLLLELDGGGSVVLGSEDDSKEALWTVFWNNGSLSLLHTASNQAVYLEQGATQQSRVLTDSLQTILPQRFLFTSAALISNGYYVIQSALDGLVLDVAAGDRRNQANVQLYTSNDTNAQKFYIELVDNDVYRILSAATGRAVDVAGGSTQQGANVQMFRANGTGAQLWKAQLGKGGYLTFLNGSSGMALDVAGAENYPGVNVQVYAFNGSSAQQFLPIGTVYTPDVCVVLDVPVYNQYAAGLPTGCESCALTNALRYYGLNLGDAEIADVYMPWSSWDFVYAFWGDPHDAYSNSTMAPCIVNTANSCLAAYGVDLHASNATGSDFYSLFSSIESGNPVVIWSTINMQNPGAAYGWQDGYTIYSHSHTVVLAGYNKADGTVYVSDSISGTYWCSAGDLAWLYDQMGKQAVIFT